MTTLFAGLSLCGLFGAPAAWAGEPADAATAGDAAADAAPAEEASASLDDDAAVRVIQQRPILKSMRFELFVGGGIASADTMYRHTLATAGGRFHISEWISIGATYGHYFSDRSALFDEVVDNFELFPERSQIQWYAGGDVSFVPLEGKFAVFNDGLVYFDLYLSIGGGVTDTTRGDGLKPTGMVGAGMRFFLTEWMTLSFEVRDQIFVEDFNAGSELVNNIVGQAGLTFFLPFGFDYSLPR